LGYQRLEEAKNIFEGSKNPDDFFMYLVGLDNKPAFSDSPDIPTKPLKSVEELLAQKPEGTKTTQETKTNTGTVKPMKVEEIRQSGYKAIDAIYDKLNEQSISDEQVRNALKGEESVDNPLIGEMKKLFRKMADEAGVSEDILKENYFPDISKNQPLTVDNTYAGKLASQAFGFTKKNKGLIPDEELLKDRNATKQYYDWTLSRKYGDELEVNRIMKDNNIPETSRPAVEDMVKKQAERLKWLEENHWSNTPFGEVGEVDYVAEIKKYNDEIAELSGKTIKREKIKPRFKGLAAIADTLIDQIRIDDTLIKQRTNDEIFKAYQDVRDSYLPDTQIGHGAALKRFMETLAKYDIEDNQVNHLLNKFIDNEIKIGKVKQGIVSQAMRLVTGIFSGAHIGGNVKTIVQQPTELFRVAYVEGFDNFTNGLKVAVKDGKRIAKKYGLDEMEAQTLAVNPEWKKVKNPNLLDKTVSANDKLLNITMAGMKFSERIKNIILAASAEQRGLKEGLELGSPEMAHFVRDELFTIGHIGAKYSTPQIVKGGGKKAALFQYGQYALKNFVLKYDTGLDMSKTDAQRAAGLIGLVAMDGISVLTMAAITGIPIKGVLDLFNNSQLPTGYGPILSVPKELLTEAIEYKNDMAKAKPGEEDQVETLRDRWSNTLQRNVQPVGNQYLKTKGTMDVFDKGYAESKKGNVKYTTGELNQLQKTQAFLFGTGAIPNKQKADKMYADLDSGKNDVYPTLNKTKSTVLKQLPKDQQEAYYNKQLALAEPNANLISGKTPLSKVFGTKTTKDISIIPSKDAPRDEVTKFNSYVREKLDNGLEPSSEELKAYYFRDVDAMPETSISQKQEKLIKRFAKLKTIADSDIDEGLKDKLIDLSGLTKEDANYYREAKKSALVNQLQYEEKSQTMKREDWLMDLAKGRKVVGDVQLADGTTIDGLYEKGLLEDSERDFLKAIRFDVVTNKYYMDRDYKGGSGSGVSYGGKELTPKQLADMIKFDMKLETMGKPLSSIIRGSGSKTASPKLLSEVLSYKPQKAAGKTPGYLTRLPSRGRK
jgi:hypothetical protein